MLTQDEANSGDQPEEDQPEETRARRRRVWRRVRRTGYALAFLLIAIPVAVFAICYQVWDVPDPDQIAAEQNQSITLYYADGVTELSRISPPGGARTHVRFTDIPVHVQNAILAAEDNTFWDNSGYDITGIIRAGWNNLTGDSGGGSTITQQYIKKATGNDDHSVGRKFRELVLAKKLADTYDKKDLLTAYLNTVYFGRGANGIQAAARAYFGKDVQALDVSQAALLAGVIQRPTYWDPAVDPENAERRWRFVIDQMAGRGWLSDWDKASARLPKTLEREADASRTSAQRHIQNQVLGELEERADLRRDEAHRRGYKIITTIDKDAQVRGEHAMSEAMIGQPDYLRAALVSIDPRTGGVAAYHGGGTGTGIDYAQSPQEAGTSFSTFVGVAALQDGIKLDSWLDGTSPRMVDGIPFQNPEGVRCSPCSVRKALAQTVNTAMAELASRVGTAAVAEAAHLAGIPRELRGKPTMTAKPGAAPDTRIAIGSGATMVRTIDMAAAYATFAADGQRTTPHFVQRVVDGMGSVRYESAFGSVPGVSPRVARGITEALTPAGKRFPMPNGSPAAVRPGVRAYGENGATAKAWMVGYTGELSTAVWMGADKLLPLKGIFGGREHDITGVDEPAHVWRAVMDGYHSTRPPNPLARPTPR